MSKTIATVIAVILFIGVIFQAMVIIDYHSDEFNLGFFRKRENTVVYFESFDEAVTEQYFKPFDIYLKEGDKTWILKKKEDLFTTLWQDGKKVLKEAFSKEVSVRKLTWSTISSNAGILFKMGNELPAEFVNFILGNENYVDQIDSVEKFLVVPNGENMDLYIKSGNDIYESKNIPANGLFTGSNFSGLIELFNADPYYSQNSYTEIHTFVDEGVLEKYIEPDIPVTFDINSRNLPWLKLSTPKSIRNYMEATTESNEDIKQTAIEKASAIIKSEIISRNINTYEIHLDSSDNLFLSNQFNIYEISKDGWISYNYTEGTEGDEKGNINTAFLNAVETLSNLTGFSGNSENLYLSNIIEENDTYKFCFDYRFNGSVIVFNGKNHAVEIRSTATRTIEASIYPLNIEEMTGDDYIESKYKTTFLFITNYNGITNINTIEAYEMYLGYIKTDAMLEVVKPVWVIEKKSGEKQLLNLVEAGD